MPMHVEIPDDLAHELAERAKLAGSDPERLAVTAIRQGLHVDEHIIRLLAPVRIAFDSSGMTEDEAVELFEKEKHEMRRERREGHR